MRQICWRALERCYHNLSRRIADNNSDLKANPDVRAITRRPECLYLGFELDYTAPKSVIAFAMMRSRRTDGRLGEERMEFSLRPDLQKYIDTKIQSGQYRSVDEALNKAVELLKRQEEAENKLEGLLLEAEESGPATEMTAKDWSDIEAEGLKRLRAQKSA